MSHEKDRYRFDETRVISEMIEGEFVVVHFESGCYFSIRGTGADICRLLTAGCTVGDVVERLAAHHHLPAEKVSGEVDAFVTRLTSEHLMILSDRPVASSGSVAISAEAFSAPTLEKFDDMADQLLLDPIHEIGEAGWPVRPAA